MNEEQLADLLREADRGAGAAPGVTVEGVRAAGRRWAVRRAVGACVVAGVVMGLGGWRGSVVRGREARRVRVEGVVAEMRETAGEMARCEARVRDLLAVEAAGGGVQVAAGMGGVAGLSLERGVAERVAAVGVVEGDAARERGDEVGARARYGWVVRDYPRTLGGVMAGVRIGGRT